MTFGAAALGAVLALAQPPGGGPPPSVPVELRGIAIGARIPALRAKDQFGQTREFGSLAGSKGLVLLFVRSADW